MTTKQKAKPGRKKLTSVLFRGSKREQETYLRALTCFYGLKAVDIAKETGVHEVLVSNFLSRRQDHSKLISFFEDLHYRGGFKILFNLHESKEQYAKKH